MNAILKFFGSLLSIFDSVTGSYLLALFIFALLVKLILLPFGIKQQKNSIKQAHVRPKEMAIRNKYKGRNDQRTQQKMNNEIMELYQQEGYNPASGCLPLLIQLPIILLLYKVLEEVQEMMEAYNQRRRFLMSEFRRMNIQCFEPFGAFCVFPSVQEFGMTSEEFAMKFLEAEKVAVVHLVANGSRAQISLEISAF